MGPDPYRAPSSDMHLARATVPGTRMLHCAVAFVAGYVALPLSATGLIVATGGRFPPLTGFLTWQSAVFCSAGGVVAALSVMPFRRLTPWLALVAGMVPVVGVVLVALAVGLYRRIGS